MIPLPAVCRLALLALAIGVACPATAQAVIPGIAPSLIAVVPQVILLLLGIFALVLSPRAWWRLLAATLRHPLRSAAVLIAGTSVVYGGMRFAAHLPRPAPGEPIPETVQGFVIGDPHAGRCRSSGLGAVCAPEIVPAPAMETLWGGVDEMAALGERILLVRRGGEEIACADTVRGEVIWRRRLDGALAAGPLGFEREAGSGRPGSGLVAVTASRATAPSGTLSLLSGDDGAVSGRIELASRPTAHAAIVDDRVVVVLEDSVASFFLSGPGAPRLAWSSPRPVREARGLAGDPSGRFFLLDRESLLEGDLADGGLREVARFEPDSPVRLAARDSRPCVLTVSPRGKARLHGIDPSPRGALPEGPRPGDSVLWTVEVGRPIGDDLSIAPFGIVVTLSGELLVLDPLTGGKLGTLPVDSPPACPAAVGGFSCYLQLAGGRLLRYSPGLGRVDWSLDLPAPAAQAGVAPLPAPGALVVVRDRLVTCFGGTPRVIAERKGAPASPWSHWRGGADRTGACEGSSMPLAARVLWRRDARGPATDGTREKGRYGEGAAEVSVLPLSEGWLVAGPSGGRTRFSWVDDGGSPLAERMEEGHALGTVRMEARLFAGMGIGDGEGAVLCLDAERQAARTSLKYLWRAPTPPLAGSRPVACGGDLVIVALRSSILALSADDGRRRWESRVVGGGPAPLVAGGRVLVSGDDGRGDGLLAALAALDGRLLWERRERGWRWGPPTLAGGTVLVPGECGGRGRIDALRPEDGSVLRSVPLGDEAAGGPLGAAGGLVSYAGRSGGTFLLPLEGSAPLRISEDKLPGGRFPVLSPILGFDLLVHASGPSLRCADASTREAVWEVALPAPPSDAALARGRILVAVEGEVLCLGAD